LVYFYSHFAFKILPYDLNIFRGNINKNRPMKILISNDDGIYAPGLWVLVKELKQFCDIIVAAPDREQSAIGTAITLHHPLRIQKVRPEVVGVETYAVGGTPGDSVIMALSGIVKGDVDLIISGINNGPNLGDDVFISGTVSGAMQAYLHGFSAISVSVNEVNSLYLEDTAKFIGYLIKKLNIKKEDENYFLNVNVPSLPLPEIKGIKVARLSTSGYADSVEEGYDGRRHYYWLKHQKAENHAAKYTDAWIVDHRYISISPLHTYLFNKKIPSLAEQLGELTLAVE
jgi:5'-nucleotidase